MLLGELGEPEVRDGLEEPELVLPVERMHFEAGFAAVQKVPKAHFGHQNPNELNRTRN